MKPSLHVNVFYVFVGIEKLWGGLELGSRVVRGWCARSGRSPHLKVPLWYGPVSVDKTAPRRGIMGYWGAGTGGGGNREMDLEGLDVGL